MLGVGIGSSALAVYMGGAVIGVAMLSLIAPVWFAAKRTITEGYRYANGIDWAQGIEFRVKVDLTKISQRTSAKIELIRDELLKLEQNNNDEEVAQLKLAQKFFEAELKILNTLNALPIDILEAGRVGLNVKNVGPRVNMRNEIVPYNYELVPIQKYGGPKSALDLPEFKISG